MRSTSACFPAIALCLLPALLGAQSPIGHGNLVVVRVGDGVAALSSAAQAVFLDEYTTAGALVQSIAMPTAVNGANQPLTNSGTATSEGILNLSVDGRYLVSGGYGAIPGTTGIAATTSATVNRVIARIDLNGNVDTTTALNNAFSGNNIRSATSTDGSQFWAAGANGGIQYATLGAVTATALNSVAPTNNRVVGIYAGQLYASSASGSFQGVSAVGTGLPTTTGQVLTLLPGFATTAGPSTYDFFFADASTLYVADDRTTGAGGILKWTASGGVWTLQYTLTFGTLGCRGLTGVVNGGVATLYATTTASDIVTVTDTGASSVVSPVVTSASNTVFRGLRLITTPGSVTFAGTGSPTTVGVPTIGSSNGLPVLGNAAFTMTAGNLLPSGIGFTLLSLGSLGAGLPLPGAPATLLIYVAPNGQGLLLLADALGNASQPLGIPPIPGLVGLPLALQVLAFDPTMVEPLPFGSSVGMQVRIGN